MGASPLHFWTTANDKLKPNVVTEIVNGMVSAMKNSVSLVGGETAEMPDTYFPGEHDLVGVITGVVEKDKIIIGKTIAPNDVIVEFHQTAYTQMDIRLSEESFLILESFHKRYSSWIKKIFGNDTRAISIIQTMLYLY